MSETSEQAQYLIPAAASLAYGELFATLLMLVLVPVLIAIIEDFKRVGREEGRSVALLTVLEARFGASPLWGAVLKDLEGSGSMGEALRLASTAADGQAFEAALRELLGKGG